jgi:RNA polymerase-binding protein DksA
MLTKEKIERYREVLEREKEKLLKEIETDKKMLDFGADTADPEDEEADEAEELGNELAVETVLRNRVNQIDAALKKIKDGAYGACSKCGGEISEKVLNAAPESDLCENCKKS